MKQLENWGTSDKCSTSMTTLAEVEWALQPGLIVQSDSVSPGGPDSFSTCSLPLFMPSGYIWKVTDAETGSLTHQVSIQIFPPQPKYQVLLYEAVLKTKNIWNCQHLFLFSIPPDFSAPLTLFALLFCFTIFPVYLGPCNWIIILSSSSRLPSKSL